MNSQKFDLIIDTIQQLYYKAELYFELQTTLQKVILCEFLLVIFVMVILFSYHRLTISRLKTVFKLQESAKKYILELMSEGQSIDPEHFVKSGWNDLKVIVPVLEKLDEEHKLDPKWLTVMDSLLDDVLFPLARKMALSLQWENRNWAIRCFSLSPMKRDEHLLLGTLLDTASLNRFASIRPLLRIGTEYATNIMIEVISAENRHTRAVYYAMMNIGGEKFYDEIRKRLINERSIEKKQACIDILTESIENSDLFLIKQDLHSYDKRLRLATIRCLSKIKLHHSTQILMTFLNDEAWEVRAISAKMLGERKGYQAIPLLLKNTSDKNWWVRINSMTALSQMGIPGRTAIESITKEKDKYAFEMREYFETVFEEQRKKKLKVYKRPGNNEKKKAA